MPTLEGMRVHCFTCDQRREMATLTVTATVFVAVPECSYLDLRCPPDECSSGVRMFAHPDDIHARAEQHGYEITYDAVPPLEVIGTYYLQMRRAGRVDVTRPGA